MKKIAISANTSWYLYNFRLNTIKALTKKGFDVVVVAPRDDYSIYLEKLGITYVDIAIDQGGTNPVKDISSLFCFFNIYRKYRPEVVLNFTPKNNIYGTLAARVVGAKVINNIAGLGLLFINENFTSLVARFLYKISQPHARKIFFQNEDDKAIFESYGLAPMYLTDRLPGSGVDLSRFTVTPCENDGVVRFLLVARMLYDKGVAYYVEAARKLKEKYGDKVEFRLLGFLDVNNPSAVSKKQMNLWVEEGVVNYLGTSDKVEEEIEKVDCIVLPSYYREGVPKSLLEAGSMGKPIITTNSVGCRETVEHGINGFLCEPKSTESLCDVLESMLNMSHETRLGMGLKSRKKIEKEFDENIVIKKYLDAIEEALTLKE